MKYKQCKLVFFRNDGISIGCRTQVSWIPADYAVKGKYIKLKEDGMWSDDWKVSEIYGECDEKALPNVHKMVKSHRKAN